MYCSQYYNYLMVDMENLLINIARQLATWWHWDRQEKQKFTKLSHNANFCCLTAAVMYSIMASLKYGYMYILWI